MEIISWLLVAILNATTRLAEKQKRKKERKTDKQFQVLTISGLPLQKVTYTLLLLLQIGVGSMYSSYIKSPRIYAIQKPEARCYGVQA